MKRKPIVLVIDDDLDLVPVFILMLNSSGFEVHAALDAAQGVAMARRHRPDVVLMDILMPGMQGSLLCSLMKDCEELRDLPVILVSSLPEQEIRSRMQECGAVDFLVKPFRRETLLTCVRRWCERRSLVFEDGRSRN